MKFFRNRKNKIASTICRNCDTQTHGRYCHVCGQDIFAGRETSVGQMIYSFLENAFAFDRKISKTYYYLLFRPGFLSLEYLRGRIVRYISPTKLLWFIVIVFFALTITLSSLTVNKKGQQKKENILPNTEQAEQKTYEKDENNNIILKTGPIQLDSDQLLNIFTTALPYLAFISIPGFAFLMYVFFRNKRRLFVNSLIFSTHLYAALFLIMLIYYLINLALPKDFHFHALIRLILILIPFIYYFAAIRVFYKSRYIGVVIKGGIVIFLGLLIMAFILLAFVLLVALYIKMTKA
ncbi:MAG: DUF3667 domain-containing protein [Prevotellaceae bacterium]|jgi:hypothetical protein|nr:DUF3667 domain-containing protein [Prevotellaceae bacterium]